MSFYVCSNGAIKEISFQYLPGLTEERVEKTLPGSSSSSQVQQAHKKSLKPTSYPEGWVIDIMTKSVFVLSPVHSFFDAFEMMKAQTISHIPLVEKGTLVGMVSDKDLLPYINSIDFSKRKLREIMSKVILLVHENTPVTHVAKVLINERISSLPVVAAQDKLVGIVTQKDVLKSVYE